MLSDIERLSNDQKKYKGLQPCQKAVAKPKNECATTFESQPVSLASKFAQDILKFSKKNNK